MKFLLQESAQRDIGALPPEDKLRFLNALFALPAAFRDPARHAGIGLRKLHASGIWEARLGLSLRMVFGLDRDTIRVLRIAGHNEVQRFLRAL